MVLKSTFLLAASIQEGVTFVRAGVMESVSGFREISCREGKMRICSLGLRRRRSWKDAATVEMARRSEEDTRMDSGADGSFLNICNRRFSSGL